MSDELIKWAISQGISTLILVVLLVWGWPQFTKALKETLKEGFADLHKRIDLLYKNDRIRMKIGYMRELREQGVQPEQARLLAIELVGNGDHDNDGN